MAHRVRIFWATHQAHHSSQYFNFATALRQKWNISGDVFLRALLPLFGVPPWIVFASFSINLIYQFWIHTERIGKLWRPIEFVFNTPSHHRVHHGMDEHIPRQELRRHPDPVGQVVRQLPAGDLPAALRADQTGATPTTSGSCRPTNTWRSRATSGRRAAGATGSATSSDRRDGRHGNPSNPTYRRRSPQSEYRRPSRRAHR